MACKIQHFLNYMYKQNCMYGIENPRNKKQQAFPINNLRYLNGEWQIFIVENCTLPTNIRLCYWSQDKISCTSMSRPFAEPFGNEQIKHFESKHYTQITLGLSETIVCSTHMNIFLVLYNNLLRWKKRNEF